MICVTFPFSGLNHKLSAKTDPEQFPMNRKKSNPRKIATPLVQMTRGESHVYRRLLGAKVCRAKVTYTVVFSGRKSAGRKSRISSSSRGESHVYRRLLGAKVCRAKVHGAKVVGPKVRERSRPTRSPAPRRCWFLF